MEVDDNIVADPQGILEASPNPLIEYCCLLIVSKMIFKMKNTFQKVQCTTFVSQATPNQAGRLIIFCK